MRNLNELKDLARYAAKGEVPTDFSNSDVNEVREVLREELNNLAGDFNKLRRNEFDVYEIIQIAVDTIAPNDVMNRLGQFAEVRQFKNGQNVQFKVKRGRTRAKRFVTKAAASGVYRAFRLDTDVIDLKPSAIGTAAYIDFERYLSGDEDIGEIGQIVVDSIVENVYYEIQKALRATINEASRPAANKVVDTSFNADNFAKLCNTVKAYGQGAVIFATPEFIASMGVNTVSVSVTPNASVTDIEDIRAIGMITMFRGCPVIPLPQSFTDETNTHTVLDPQIAYVFPTGGEKIVKVGFEGDTIVKKWDNRDNSMELQAYKKMGIAITSYHNWGIYRNSGIAQTYVEE